MFTNTARRSASEPINTKSLDSALGRYSYILTSIVLAALFALRPMPVTYDDLNYLAYFSGLPASQTMNWWSWFIEEPLWRAGSHALGSVLGVELAYRLVIFSAVSGFFWAARVVVGRASWIIVLLFIIDMSVSTSLYSLAVRQGVATSASLLLMVMGVGPILAFAVAASIHTGLAIFVPAAVVVQLMPKRSVLFTAVATVASALALFVLSLSSSLSEVDLGRRTEHYTTSYELTTLYYVGFFVRYAVVLFVARPPSIQSKYFSLYLLCVLTAAVALVFIAQNGGFARLLLTVNVLISFYLAATIRSRGSQIGALIWVSMIVFTAVNEARKAENFVDTWAGGWAIVLGLN